MQLVELTKKFLSTQNISQNNLSDRLGINKSYMVDYMKEGSSYKYASKVEPLLEKLCGRKKRERASNTFYCH